MIYLDACALIKLIGKEAESAALQDWLGERPDAQVITSEMAYAELPRAIRRSNHDDQGKLLDAAELAADLADAHEILGRVKTLTIDRERLSKAGAFESPMLRAIDAIHLVSALDLDIPDLEFVTYDRRLAKAAETAGLRVTAPD